MRDAPPPLPHPLPNIFEKKKNKGKLCVILKGIYQRFRINLNRKITKFSDFASDFASTSWSEKSPSGEIV